MKADTAYGSKTFRFDDSGDLLAAVSVGSLRTAASAGRGRGNHAAAAAFSLGNVSGLRASLGSSLSEHFKRGPVDSKRRSLELGCSGGRRRGESLDLPFNIRGGWTVGISDDQN